MGEQCPVHFDKHSLVGSVVLLLVQDLLTAGALLVLALLPFPWYLMKGALIVQVLVVLRGEIELISALRARATHRTFLAVLCALCIFSASGQPVPKVLDLIVAVAATALTKFLIPLMAFRSVGDWRIKHFEEKYNYTDSEREFLRDRVLTLYCREWGFVIKPPNPKPASADTTRQEPPHP